MCPTNSFSILLRVELLPPLNKILHSVLTNCFSNLPKRDRKDKIFRLSIRQGAHEMSWGCHRNGMEITFSIFLSTFYSHFSSIMLGEKKGHQYQNSYSISLHFPFPFTYKNIRFHLPFLKDKANNNKIVKCPLVRIIAYSSWEATQRQTSSMETMWALDVDHPGPRYIMSSEPQPPRL